MSKPATKLKTISRSLDDLAENVNGALKFTDNDAAEKTEKALADTVKALNRTARSMAKQARKFGKRASKKAARGLNEHPMTAAVIAASAAALISALLVTKSKSAA